MSVATGMLRRWGFTNGENHTALEDAILESIDIERGVAEESPPCQVCGKTGVPISRVQGKDVCRVCRSQFVLPLTRESVTLTPTGQNKRRGEYWVETTGGTPELIHAPNKLAAAIIVARSMGRERLPKGSRIWGA